MAQVKITTKLWNTHHLEDGIHSFWKFNSQETEKAEITDPYTGRKETKEVPKWEILVDPDHPRIKKLKENLIILQDNMVEGNFYNSCEISFVDDKSLLKGGGGGSVLDKDKRKRIFFEKERIKINIKDISFFEKIKELKNLNNLIPGEKWKWESFIDDFRRELGKLTNEDASKYQEGKKFIDELEAILKNKGNDDNREREREREREFWPIWSKSNNIFLLTTSIK